MADVNFTLLGSNCTGGYCPSFYEGDDGKFYVKGHIVSDQIRQILNADETEDVVSIPKELIEAIKKI